MPDPRVVLPNEMMYHVFNFLKKSELMKSVPQVCKNWHEVAHTYLQQQLNLIKLKSSDMDFNNFINSIKASKYDKFKALICSEVFSIPELLALSKTCTKLQISNEQLAGYSTQEINLLTSPVWYITFYKQLELAKINFMLKVLTQLTKKEIGALNSSTRMQQAWLHNANADALRKIFDSISSHADKRSTAARKAAETHHEDRDRLNWESLRRPAWSSDSQGRGTKASAEKSRQLRK